MKHFYIAKKVLMIMAGFFMALPVIGQESLVIKTGDLELEPGETVQVEAEYTNQGGEVAEVDVVWYVNPGYLGKVNMNDVLTAHHPGEGFLYARYRTLKDSVKLVVTGTPKNDDDDEEEEEEETDLPKVKIIPGMVRVAAGDSVELVAFYRNESGEREETAFTWSVFPAELGEFPDPAKSKFMAYETGQGIIVASVGELADTVRLKVVEPRVRGPHWNNGRQLTITPGDTVIHADDLEILQYTAVFKMNGNVFQDEETAWSLSGDPIGTIDESTGLLTLSGETGLALVKAKYGMFSASVELLVVDPGMDTEVNTITIHRVLPDGSELPGRVLKEGDTWRIGGLPFPLNILNGGVLHFPFGCISEDIVIYMFIPEEYAENMDEEGGEVVFGEEIITGVKFSVKPVESDVITEPYYFDVPLNLALVYKRGLLDSLGISPENLDVFFAENTGFITDGAGNVAVDTVRNKIYASIEHFSTIVVRPKCQVTIAERMKNDSETTLNVYPNPFTNSTRISFQMEEKSEVELSIFSLTGQKVITLVKELRGAGPHSVYWNGKNQTGIQSAPGVYFCRMVQNGREAEVKRIILQK
jgi:hypothetical protein